MAPREIRDAPDSRPPQPQRIHFLRRRFVSGMALDGTSQLLLTYGVNDCEAKLARVSLDDVWGMLKPLPGEMNCQV